MLSLSGFFEKILSPIAVKILNDYTVKRNLSLETSSTTV